MPTQADLALQAVDPSAFGAAPTGTQADQALAAVQATQVATPSWYSNLGSQASELGSALGHHLANLPHGVAQLVENATSGVANAVAPSSAITRYITNVVDSDNAGMAQREADYQKSTPNSAGAYTGATVGEVLPFLLSGPANLLGKIGDTAAAPAMKIAELLTNPIASGAAKVAAKASAGAAQGAAVAAASPVTTAAPTSSDPVTGQQPPSYWDAKAQQMQMGAGVGAVLPPAMQALGKAGQAVGGVLAPVFRPSTYVASQLADKLGAGAPDVLDSLSNAASPVPGSLPTSAQVAGNTTLLQFEKAFRNTPSGAAAFANREMDNNAARWNALNGVAGSDTDLAAATSARSTATAPLYDAVHQAQAPVDSTLTDLMQRPAVADAMQAADTLAKNEGNAIQWPTAANPTISGQALDYTQRALSDAINQADSRGMDKQVRALTMSQSDLTNWADQNIPGLDQAKAAYGAYSVPVNTMEAGQSIASRLSQGAENVSKQTSMTLPGYNAALVQALKQSPYGIEPGAQNTLQGIAQDLKFASRSNGTIKAPGSDTAYNVNANGMLAKLLYGGDFQGSGTVGTTLAGLAGGALGLHGGGPLAGIAGASGAGATAAKLGQVVGSRLNAKMAELLMNPSALKTALTEQGSKAPPSSVARAIKGAQPAIPYAASSDRRQQLETP